MIFSERTLKWLVRFYPPLFFQRIRVIGFDAGFSGVSVKITKSIFNKNYNKSIFGGTIFAAADPFYPILFHQILLRKKYRVIIWLKSASIQYLKPGRTDLFFKIKISPAEMEEAEHILNTDGKYVKSFLIEMYNKDGELCVAITNELYVRNLNLTHSATGA